MKSVTFSFRFGLKKERDKETGFPEYICVPNNIILDYPEVLIFFPWFSAEPELVFKNKPKYCTDLFKVEAFEIDIQPM